ncbi:MAG: hypothetical protein IJC04_03590 [Oscillospiraceae bacterium]|nr:hypothetical protein [Oscillospiraceae bacterium]
MSGFETIKAELPEIHMPETTNDVAQDVKFGMEPTISEEKADCIFNELMSDYNVQSEDMLIKEYAFDIVDLIGYSEEDFSFDDMKLDIDVLKEYTSLFDEEAWESFDTIEKINAIKQFGEALADQLGIVDVPNIEVYRDLLGRYGAYYPDDNKLKVNVLYIDDAKETLDTVAHEMRHAYQRMRAYNPQTEEDYKYKANFNEYIYSNANFSMYQSQYVEAEARAFADYIKNL